MARCSVSVSQCSCWVHFRYDDDYLWDEGDFSCGILSAPESTADPCLYPHDVGGFILHAALAGVRRKTGTEAGAQAQTDGVLHPVWGIGFTAGRGRGNRTNVSVDMKKFL